MLPAPEQADEDDPWFRVGRDGERLEELSWDEAGLVPPRAPSWSSDGTRAAWESEGRVLLYDAAAEASPGPGSADLLRTRILYAGPVPARQVRITRDGGEIRFLLDEDLHGIRVADGALRRLTRKHVTEPDSRTEMGRWLDEQQLELFEHHRRLRDREEEARRRARTRDPLRPQPIPVEPGVVLDEVRVSPDGRFVVVRARVPAEDREPTVYLDYVTGTGYAEAREARAKAGEPRDRFRMGILPLDPAVPADSVELTWVEPAEAEGREVVFHGPWWSLEGDRAVIQILSQDHKDLWISELDPATGRTRVLDHQHDPAWLGGPPPQAGRLQPALLEWLPGERFVFASERSGWSHLYLTGMDGDVRPLTRGEWEVRGAELSRDRSRWLLQASREHPADDHLYLLPAAGGEMVRLTEGVGRHDGALSPDGTRLARVSDDVRSLPDLFLSEPEPGAAAVRVTRSGSPNHARVAWVEPEIVSFAHPDGDPVWAALYLPADPLPEAAAVLHIHGGGYRQFAHRGWSVYGWANHVGFIQWLLQEGYVVLDFDYRGSAGFGRDYRTDIYRSMGIGDVDGAVAAVDYLAREHGVDPGRVGMYGVSYGGFFTIMSLLRHPGVFAAGVSNDGVTDWAHYSDSWTTRILNLPHQDPEAYRVSSPIYYADALEDPLLLVHSVIDDNVHFQDAVRLVQRFIELEREFEVMYYPVERHNFAYEPSRLDYYRRMAGFFRRHLVDGPGEAR
jgi:dipeptidyl aminopeptidase/acylaminoacyl peptidase